MQKASSSSNPLRFDSALGSFRFQKSPVKGLLPGGRSLTAMVVTEEEATGKINVCCVSEKRQGRV
jgi:hypothetical protein